jgi:hypothetical protein
MTTLIFKPTAEQVQKITGKPLANIKVNLPVIYEALEARLMIATPTVVATLATVATECPFAPINEYGGPSYWKRYEGRADLGNTQPGDGVRFHGRGFVQLTGRANYSKYGKLIGADLIGSPDLALQPAVAARILIDYVRSHGIDVWAARGDWLKVRKLVNGGTNGWEYFGGPKGVVWKFLELAYAK